MKAALCFDLNGPDSIRISDVELPAVKPDEVLVKVKAISLNFSDLLMTEGKYQIKPALPFSPGSEFSGVAELIGKDVTEISVGERVAGYRSGNVGQEFVAVAANSLIKVPDELSFDKAACSIVTFGTAVFALTRRIQSFESERILITGASGGAGLAAIQIAKAYGLEVVAIASSPEKLRLCVDHGADHAIKYDDQILRKDLFKITPGGVDIFYDLVGGQMTTEILKSMAWNGRVLVVGFAGGSIPSVPLNLLLLRNISLVGVAWWKFIQLDRVGFKKDVSMILEMISSGKLFVHVDKIFPLSEIAEGLKCLANRSVSGKVVVIP